MAHERDETVQPPTGSLQHARSGLPLPAETHIGNQMLVIITHALDVLQCVVQSTSSTPFRRLVSLIVLVIVLVLVARVPMPVLPELPTLNPLPLVM